MKTIIQPGTTTYRAHCDECGCRFTYEREDVWRNYVEGGERVSCPHCGHAVRHLGATSSRSGCGGTDPIRWPPDQSPWRTWPKWSTS